MDGGSVGGGHFSEFLWVVKGEGDAAGEWDAVREKAVMGVVCLHQGDDCVLRCCDCGFGCCVAQGRWWDSGVGEAAVAVVRRPVEFYGGLL